MYLTQKNQIRGLSKAEFTALKELCRLSKNLYNVGLYSVRQFYFSEQKYLRYESNCHHCKGNENYQLLNTDIAQQTLKVAGNCSPQQRCGIANGRERACLSCKYGKGWSQIGANRV